MRVVILGLTLFLTLAQIGCATPSWARVTVEPLGDDPDVASELDYGDLIVYASYNGNEPLRLLLDTGALNHLLTPEAAARVGLQTNGKRKVIDFAGGHASHSTAYVDSVVVGPVTLRDMNATVMERSGSAEVDGVLGMIGLQLFTLTLDFDQGGVRISDERLDPDADGVTPFRFDSDYKIRVPLDMVDRDGQATTVWASLDTGHNGQLLLDQSSSERFIARNRLHRRGKATGVLGVGYTIDFHPLLHDPVFAGIRYSGVITGADQRANNIGTQMLEGCVITIDWPSELIRIERKDQTKRLIYCDSIGIFMLVSDPDGYRAFVHPNSIAAEQGLDLQKLVLTINTQPVDERFDTMSFWPIAHDATEVVIEYKDQETGEIGICRIPIEDHHATGALP